MIYLYKVLKCVKLNILFGNTKCGKTTKKSKDWKTQFTIMLTHERKEKAMRLERSIQRIQR